MPCVFTREAYSQRRNEGTCWGISFLNWQSEFLKASELFYLNSKDYLLPSLYTDPGEGGITAFTLTQVRFPISVCNRSLTNFKISIKCSSPHFVTRFWFWFSSAQFKGQVIDGDELTFTWTFWVLKTDFEQTWYTVSLLHKSLPCVRFIYYNSL